MSYRRRGGGGSKYNAKRTVVDGEKFDSQKEARRWCELLMLQKAGQISGLLRQPKYRIFVMPMIHDRQTDWIKIGEYRGDFQYWDEQTGKTRIEDVKGVKTPVYRLKKKLVEAQYGIEIEEI